MNHRVIREKFFSFFVQEGHTKVPSSSLIPAQDPTLLFANAGMNQFKDIFLGKEKRNYTRAVSIQKCIRAGGKHNDLENVGFTQRHLTFFEMMGNFSFGDYFKREAIMYAWNFLTKSIGLPADRLYASVYTLDEEAYNIWHKEIGLPAHRVVKLGEADNFWQMGDTGPCGPCSEIYIDRGSALGCQKASCAPGCSCDRFLEIWNLVFMQFDRQLDTSMIPLQQKGVDTGMGLERLCAVVQHKDSVFETDLFSEIIAHLEELSKKSYQKSNTPTKAAFRVVADHIRSTSFAIADGGIPSNEGRGYVIRKIIRRAVLFAQKLGDSFFFPALVPAVIKQMGPIYPELIAQQELITTLLVSETEKFAHNLMHGQSIFAKFTATNQQEITGEQAFKLYDTYGFPLELTKVLAHEKGLTVDTTGFEVEMEKQRKLSGKKIPQEQAITTTTTLNTIFTGYDELETTTTITALLIDHQEIDRVPEGERCWVITPRSPFYIECGGQVSDHGMIIIGQVSCPIINLKKIGNALAAEIKTISPIQVGDQVTLKVDASTRLPTMKNHTATHLLQSALVAILGPQVRQSGSLVVPDYLRFDFTYSEQITQEQIDRIEMLVNQKIMENITVTTTVTTYQEAISRKVIAFFGEKYNPESVRIVEIPGFSAELCGGTHVRATGDIGCFKITEATSLSAGNRRIVAVTGPKAIGLFQDTFTLVKTVSQEFKTKMSDVAQAILKQREQNKHLQHELKLLKKEFYKSQLPAWLESTELIQQVPFLYLQLNDAASDELRDIAVELVQKKPGFYVVTQSTATQAALVIAFSPTLPIDISTLRTFLQTYGIRSGGTGNVLQGGAVHIDNQLQTKLREWLHKGLSR
jgi:alanyl-tRNA synthetase